MCIRDSAIGGVCPFAVNDNVKVYLDESLQRFETVFPAAGSPNSAIELTIPELEKYSNFLQWIDAVSYTHLDVYKRQYQKYYFQSASYDI